MINDNLCYLTIDCDTGQHSCDVFGQVMSPHHSDQMSQRSQAFGSWRLSVGSQNLTFSRSVFVVCVSHTVDLYYLVRSTLLQVFALMKRSLGLPVYDPVAFRSGGKPEVNHKPLLAINS